jgi:quercetin dioxygenase-like cupin family protein
MISIDKKPATILIAALAILSLSVKAQSTNGTVKNSTSLYAKGKKAPADYFTGSVWVNMLVDSQDGLDCSIGSVTFEPETRTNWHQHPGGQVLIVTAGKGYYQEKGKPIQTMMKGDVVKCQPNVEHWHGATPESSLTHIAMVPDAEKGATVWLQKVTDEEYRNLKQKVKTH